MDPGPSDYSVHPSRIKLYVDPSIPIISPLTHSKETRHETAQRLYTREIRRSSRHDERISRANGFAVSPERVIRVDSTSPPRRSRLDDHFGAVERMMALAEEEMSRSNPFWGYSDAHHSSVPRRYRRDDSPKRARRDAMREIDLAGSYVPPLGEMTEDEYSTWIREGIEHKRHARVLAEEEARRALQRELDRVEEIEREVHEKAERRRRARQKERDAKAAIDRLVDERARYRARWRGLGDTEVESVQLGYEDVPWPVYRPNELDNETIRTFLSALAEDSHGKGVDGLRKVYKDAIRLFHPDRFNHRILSRVRAGEVEQVREGMERCSRVINELAAALRG